MENQGAGPQKLIKLDAVYHSIGRAMFGVDWAEDSIWLSPGSIHDKLPFTIYRPKYELRNAYPEKLEHEAQLLENDPDYYIVPEEMCDRYDAVTSCLFDALWNHEINIHAIGKDGQLKDVPRSVWKDKNGKWEVSVYDSTIAHVS